MSSYSDYGIQIKAGKTSGEVQTTCPQCSHNRKKKTDRCLSVNLDKGVWKCHHCDWSGGLPKEVVLEKKEWVRPVWKNNTELSDKIIKWFEGRGISQATVKKAKISQSVEFMPQECKEMTCINFNYFYNGELINIKYRDSKKNFKGYTKAQRIPFNLEAVNACSEVFIVEGEMDVLSFMESGVENCISVPNGANPKNNNLDYFDDIIDLFTGKRIIIATDNDTPGRQLREDLADRFGRAECFYIDWGQYKDANECLMAEGINGILQKIGERKEFDITGSVSISHYYDEVIDLYHNGLDSGAMVGDGVLDNKLRFVKGYITTITGIPGHGKSEFVDHITLNLSIKSGWRGAFYSPENKPTRLHISKMVRKISGKGWYENNRPTELEVRNIIDFLKEKIWFIKPPKGFKIDHILESVKELKVRKNLDYFVIDAWNKLEHNYDQNETKYIGETLDKIAVFCEENNVHCFLVAHPTKMQKDKNTGIYEVPNLYSIAGSANFNNKTDNGISVYRVIDPLDNTKSHTEVHIQKVKFNHWGEIGKVEYDFDKMSLRYRKRDTIESYIPMINFKGEQMEMPKASAIKPNSDFMVEQNDCPF